MTIEKNPKKIEINNSTSLAFRDEQGSSLVLENNIIKIKIYFCCPS